MSENNCKYVEHRMFFLGHILELNEDCCNMQSMQFKKYSFNDYGENNKIEIGCTEVVKEINVLNLKCEKVTYSFLNNGCVSVIIEYAIQQDKYEEFIKCFEKIGGENFEKINEILFKRIQCFLKDASGIGLKEYLKFNKIVDYRDEIFFDKDNIIDTVVYSQHFFYLKELKEEITKEALKHELGVVLKEILEEVLEEKKLFIKIDDELSIYTYIDWGFRIWVTNKKEYKIINILDSEIVFLSKQCLMNSQVIISTEISKNILYENKFKQNIDEEELEDFICNYRTFNHLNDLITMDFDKKSKKLNDQFFKYDNFDNLIESKNDCEETILRLLNNYESKSTRNVKIILSVLLVTISVLTLFSVFNDLNQLNKTKDPYVNIPLNISLFLAIIGVIGLFLYSYRRSLKKFLNNFFDNKI